MKEEKLKKLKQILEGYANLIFQDPEVEKISEERLNICLTCTDRSDIKESSELIKLSSTCNLCGCVLQAKSRCVKNCSCPKKLW